MANILISWIAIRNDFQGGELNTDGATISFHRNFWEYDKHILLYDREAHDTKVDFLVNYLQRHYPKRIIEPRLLPINDVISLPEVKSKVEALLLEYWEEKIDIFFSPGTPIMQLVWYICHTTLGLNTRLIQTRAPQFTESGKVEQVFIEVEKDSVPMSAILKERERKKTSKPYKLTASIQPVYDNAYKVAQTDHIKVMIYGESGTGKENLAKYIHDSSPRKNRIFRAINCASFKDDLLGSQLFGHLEGAFTGATQKQIGLFEICDGGTLFMDEIGDISPFMQQSLLRVIQEGEILPLGSSKPAKVDVRIIGATNKYLPDLCKSGVFRGDLYYRLSVVELELPTLYDRGKEELNEMINFFLKSKKKSFRRSRALKLHKEARNALIHYPWPGNIRELENIIEGLYVFCEDLATKSDLPQKIIEIDPEISEKWEDVEARHFRRVYERYDRNKKDTYTALGCSPGTLDTKLKLTKLILNPERKGINSVIF